jgi:hypothetical protein
VFFCFGSKKKLDLYFWPKKPLMPAGRWWWGASSGSSMTEEKYGKKSIWWTHKIWRQWQANAARFWRKSKKRKNDFPFKNLASLNLDFAKKIAKKGKKRQKTN